MLVKAIKEYLKDNTLQDLYRATGISPSVFYSLIKRDWKKYNKTTLDILYAFFSLEHDDFYKENQKKRYPKTPSLFWTFIRQKRLKLNIDMKELSNGIKVDKRALARIESWDALPTFDSWTIQHLMDTLQFNEDEKIMAQLYINAMKWLEKMVKKNDI